MTSRLVFDPANFERRLLQDAFADGWAATHLRRAAMFEAARPRPGDHPGRATLDQLAARDARLAGTAHALRHRAAFIEDHQGRLDDALVALEHPGAAA